MNPGVSAWWCLGSPRGAQRRHLAKAKWLSYLAKAKWLRTKKLVYKFLRILHVVGQRPGEFVFEEVTFLGRMRCLGQTCLQKYLVFKSI